MITFLASLFIKDRRNYDSPAVRQAYGVLSGAVGIGLNILLFLGKWIAGTLSGSIAITADAFNNLSDAGFIDHHIDRIPASGQARTRSIRLDMEGWSIFRGCWSLLRSWLWDLS